MPKNSQRRNDVRRVNKDRRAKLDEMRRRQRAVERRKNIITFGSAILVAVLLIGAAIGFSIAKANEKDAKKNRVTNQLKAESKEGHQSKPTAAEAAAGCLGVHTDPLPKGGDHVAAPIDYSKEKYGDTAGGTAPIPPSGGRHNALSLGDKQRFYPLSEKPRPERAVHNLEHGYVVIWYDSKLPADQVALLQQMTSDPSLSRLLVVGWWQSDLPADKHVVMTSWGKTERCGKLTPDIVQNFYTMHLNAPTAPEAGLPAIPGADGVPSGTLPPQSPQPSTSASPNPSPSSTKK